MITGLFHLVWKFLWNTVVILVCVGLVFVGYKANQPMMVNSAPKGMTYIEFIQDRLDAAITVEPSRCGWGMMISLAILGPIYSIVYTSVAINPDGRLAKLTTSDPDIPKGVTGARWSEVPGIWWEVVEHLSWPMLAKPT